MKNIKELLISFGPYIQNAVTKNTAKGIVIAGITLVGSSAGPVWGFLIAPIARKYLQIDITEDVSSTQNVVLYVGIGTILFGCALICLVLYFERKDKTTIRTKNLINLRHTSIESVVEFENIQVNASKQQVSEIALDQVAEMRTWENEGLKNALIKQYAFVNEAQVMVSRMTNRDVIYSGLAHIPLTFLIGYQLSDKFDLGFSEWNQNNRNWDMIDDNRKAYPGLNIKKSRQSQDADVDAIAIKIGVTYPVTDEDVDSTGIAFKTIYSLEVDTPGRNIVVSKSQLEEYGASFRSFLDSINQKHPSAKSYHIFYSGQPSLAYVLGSKLSERMDPQIYVYNYLKREESKYLWALKMHKGSHLFDDVCWNWRNSND